MVPDDLARAIEEYHRSVDAFMQGDPEPQMRLFSHRDDVTLANPLGLPARGWDQVAATVAQAAAQVRGGEPCTWEHISGYATPDLAYSLDIQRTRMKFGDADEPTPAALRVTTIFRREEDGWRVVHRHADPITTPRPIASVVQE